MRFKNPLKKSRAKIGYINVIFAECDREINQIRTNRRKINRKRPPKPLEKTFPLRGKDGRSLQFCSLLR